MLGGAMLAAVSGESGPVQDRRSRDRMLLMAEPRMPHRRLLRTWNLNRSRPSRDHVIATWPRLTTEAFPDVTPSGAHRRRDCYRARKSSSTCGDVYTASSRLQPSGSQYSTSTRPISAL